MTFNTFDLQKFRQGKTYDVLMGVPLIIWFGYVGVVMARYNLAADARAVVSDPGDLHYNLQFWGLFASIGFNILTVYLVITRSTPIRRTRGVWGRFFGFTGTFLGVGLQRLHQVHLSFGWQLLASVLVFAGSLGSLIVLSRLGRSFSIMPEARTLVTGGPYAYARHPLYSVEMITIIGTAMMFQQPWAFLLALGVLSLLIVRSFFEEQVLMEAFPVEYESYRARVKRFGFI